MSNEILTTLHPDGNPDIDLYPNIKKENIPSRSIDRFKLDESIITLLNSAHELHPSGVNTSTNILAFTTNRGIYIGSDTGHWYYWNGTQYVDGGVYQATEIPNNSISLGKMNDNFKEYFLFNQKWNMVRKFVSTATGATGSSQNSMTTQQKVFMHRGDCIQFDEETYFIYFCKYNFSTGAYLGYLTITNNYVFNEDCYGWLYVLHQDRSNLEDSEINTQSFDLVIYSPFRRFFINVYTLDDLISALNDDMCKYINICDNITSNVQLVNHGNKTIFGNGYTITGDNVERLLEIKYYDSVLIENLKLYNSINSVLTANEYCKLTIKNCEISNSTTNDGLGVRGHAKVYVYDCKFHDNYDEGISTHDQSYIEVYNSEAYNNGFEIGTTTPSNTSFGGIHLGGKYMGIVANCNTHNNDQNGIAFITIDGNYDADAKGICFGNISYDNTNSGIRFSGVNHIKCMHNSCFNNDTGMVFSKKDQLYACAGYVGGNTLFANTTANQAIWTGGDGGLIFDNE